MFYFPIPIPFFGIIFGFIALIGNFRNLTINESPSAFVSGIFIGIIAGVLVDIFLLLSKKLK